MKTYLAALSGAALISMAPYALASSTDLTVTGLITPGACTPTISNNGVVDVGKIPAHTLNQTGNTYLGSYPLQLTVACEMPRLIAFESVDNRAGTATEDEAIVFGLGLTDEGEKLGSFYTSIQEVVVDGIYSDSIDSVDGGNSWRYAGGIHPGRLLSVSSQSDYTTPIAVKDLIMDLQIRPAITRADSLTLTNEVKIDGSGTLQLTYL
jgi:hypothetical protein